MALELTAVVKGEAKSLTNIRKSTAEVTNTINVRALRHMGIYW